MFRKVTLALLLPQLDSDKNLRIFQCIDSQYEYRVEKKCKEGQDT